MISLLVALLASGIAAAERPHLETVLAYQRDSGGWPKNYDRDVQLSATQRVEVLQHSSDNDAMIDNGATHIEIRLLAKGYRETQDERFRQAAMRGIRYLLQAQYANGGWPQRFPNPTNYAQYITFNDKAMIGVMTLLRDICEDRELYDFVSQPVCRECQLAVERGIQCILNCQIRVDGQLTVWCAQHDQHTYEPRKARSYELASLSGGESAGIVRFLMQVDHPSEAIARSIRAAVSWYDKAKIRGIKVVRKAAPGTPKGYDKTVVQAPDASPMWARFYDIETNQPIFCSRDGVPRSSLADISYERRNGYSWLGHWGQTLLEKDWPQWQQRMESHE